MLIVEMFMVIRFISDGFTFRIRLRSI